MGLRRDQEACRRTMTTRAAAQVDIGNLILDRVPDGSSSSGNRAALRALFIQH